MGLHYQNLCNNYKINWQMDHIYGNNWPCEYIILSHISHLGNFQNFPLGPFLPLSTNTRNYIQVVTGNPKLSIISHVPQYISLSSKTFNSNE